MYTRTLALPDTSFFLLGPRGTGKTTWLRQVVPESRALWFDLVTDRELVRLSGNPERFSEEVEAAAKGTWVVVDEVQRLPALLGQVHDLIARRGPMWYRFALTGSSARKLRRGGADLLPGRTVNRAFFPLTAKELAQDFSLDATLRFGTLPFVCSARPRQRIDLLEAYVENYLAQEVRAEALVKDLVPFSRFLTVASLANAQVTNVSSLARDAGVARPTVQGYFEVLTDTMLGTWLPAWRGRARVKENRHPKFYFFDAGVVRAISGRLRDAPSAEERGVLLETYLLHELRAHMNHAGTGGQLSYWRTPSGSEVDFVWNRGRRSVGIEVKASKRWRPEDARPLRQLMDEKAFDRGFVIYDGSRKLKSGGVTVLPVAEFLAALYGGRILPG